MFSIKKAASIIIVSSFIFTSFSSISQFNEQQVMAQTRRVKKKVVGQVKCVQPYKNQENSRKISLATIEPVSQGYKLRIIEELGEDILILNNKLLIVEANGISQDGKRLPWDLRKYHDVDKSPFIIKRNGYFKNGFWVSENWNCEYSGNLTFLNGADKKIFGSRRINQK